VLVSANVWDGGDDPPCTSVNEIEAGATLTLVVEVTVSVTGTVNADGKVGDVMVTVPV
jgi:hypothetical protein